MSFRTSLRGIACRAGIMCLALAMAGSQAMAQGGGNRWNQPGGLHVDLPFDQTGILDNARFKIRIPAAWNGTLIVYLQGVKMGAPPPEPSVVPPVIASSMVNLESTLLTRGYALAASEFGTDDVQVKETMQDSLALLSYFKGLVGIPTRVIVLGTSAGGIAAIKMAEDYSRSIDGAIATCAPAVGMCPTADNRLDFLVAYKAAFGWRDDLWGPVSDTKPDLNFQRDVLPFAKLPVADGSNQAQWEFIRIMSRFSPEAFWGVDTLWGVPGWRMTFIFATQTRESIEAMSGGPVARNIGKIYSLTPDENAFLASLGLDANPLLARMNADANIEASARARDYLTRFGDTRGALRRPLISMHNTMDTLSNVSIQAAYQYRVQEEGREHLFYQAYVPIIGHCAFTAEQILIALDALESWLDTGVRPTADAFPQGAGFVHGFVPPKW